MESMVGGTAKASYAGAGKSGMQSEGAGTRGHAAMAPAGEASAVKGRSLQRDGPAPDTVLRKLPCQLDKDHARCQAGRRKRIVRETGQQAATPHRRILDRYGAQQASPEVGSPSESSMDNTAPGCTVAPNLARTARIRLFAPSISSTTFGVWFTAWKLAVSRSRNAWLFPGMISGRSPIWLTLTLLAVDRRRKSGHVRPSHHE